jgi:hypothetical protein
MILFVIQNEVKDPRTTQLLALGNVPNSSNQPGLGFWNLTMEFGYWNLEFNPKNPTYIIYRIYHIFAHNNISITYYEISRFATKRS